MTPHWNPAPRGPSFPPVTLRDGRDAAALAAANNRNLGRENLNVALGLGAAAFLLLFVLACLVR